MYCVLRIHFLLEMHTFHMRHYSYHLMDVCRMIYDYVLWDCQEATVRTGHLFAFSLMGKKLKWIGALFQILN